LPAHSHDNETDKDFPAGARACSAFLPEQYEYHINLFEGYCSAPWERVIELLRTRRRCVAGVARW